MRFWSTSETSDPTQLDDSSIEESAYAKELRLLFNSIEEKINTKLKGVQFDNDFEVWGVIYVCVSDEFLDFFGETNCVRRNPKAMEIRLQLDFSIFSNAPKEKRLLMLMDLLRRSVDIMKEKKFKVNEDDRNKISCLLEELECEL
jgi:hypothetical protein